MIDVVREVEAARVIPHMVPILLDILRSGEASYNKDTLEFQFRRCLLEIIHRLPANEGVKPQAGSLLSGMFYLLRNDNEENGIVCCKIISDVVRYYRNLTDDSVKEFLSMYSDLLNNVQSVVDETLSEDSAVVEPNVAFPAHRGFKVLGELAMTTVSIASIYRQMVIPAIHELLPLNVAVMCIEAPVQHKAKTEYEATGGHWAGMAPGFKNPSIYVDFTAMQVKLLSCIAFLHRGSGTEPFGEDGETFAVTCVRLLQDCPPAAISSRRVRILWPLLNYFDGCPQDLMVVFRHILNTPYRKAILPYIDKLFDDRVLWGTGLGCRESIR